MIEGLKMMGILKPEYGKTRSRHYRLDKKAALQLSDTIKEILDGQNEIRVDIG